MVLFYAVIDGVEDHFAETPLASAKQALGITTEWALHAPFLVQVALVIFVVELGQYWMHRLMHNSFMWWTHAPHHHITQLNAAKGLVGNPLELFLVSLSVVALFDLRKDATFCAFNVLGAVSIFAHANVRNEAPRWYSYIFTTIEAHSLHHSVPYEDTRCNYANSLILIDRIFRTFREGEASVVGQGDRRRLSIVEQLVFPLRPLIARTRSLLILLVTLELVATWGLGTRNAAADSVAHGARKPIEELVPTATIHVGKTADWVAITEDAVWVGSTGPNAVSQIDPHTNTLVATVHLPGEPCAGLAVGHGSLWVPLCAHPNSLVRVDLATRKVTAVPLVGPAMREGGITSSPDAIWLIVDHKATLARIDPVTGEVRQRIHVPRGSYNPLYGAGKIWVSRADGAQVTVIDAESGDLTATLPSGPKPRFLTFGDEAVWTLNQGDGSLTRIDAQTLRVVQTTALHTPGPGGDIAFGRDLVWTTVAKTPLSIVDGHTGLIRCQWHGPGGDSLGIGHDAIWLTNYDAGTISRIEKARSNRLERY